MLGAYGALGLGVIATIPIAVLFLSGHGEPRLLWVYPAYLVGGLGAATVFWALQGVAHLATGRYLLGALSGLCLYGAIAPVVMLVERGPLDASLMLTIAAIAGFVVGPAVAFELDRWPAAT
jgi:hypothetical protein